MERHGRFEIRMSRSICILALLIAVLPTVAVAQHYAGPPSLGPFRIDKNVSMSSLFERLGRPASTRGESFCYRSAQGDAFLVLTRLDPVYDDDKVAGAVTLSTVRNCVKHPVQTATADIAHWKTEQGIGLSSAEEDVVKAYGAPTSTDDVTDPNCGLSIYGDEGVSSGFSSSKAATDCKVLTYRGTPTEDLNTAQFGLKSGKVIWILLSQNE